MSSWFTITLKVPKVFMYNSLQDLYWKTTALRLKKEKHGQVAERFQKLWDLLCEKNDYEPLCLLDIKPEDSMERFRWLQNISLPVAVQLYRYSCGNYYGNLNFIWKKEAIDDDKVIKAVDSVRQML